MSEKARKQAINYNYEGISVQGKQNLYFCVEGLDLTPDDVIYGLRQLVSSKSFSNYIHHSFNKIYGECKVYKFKMQAKSE